MNIDFVFMFDHFKMGEQWHMCIWILFKFKCGVNLQMTLHSTSLKWNCQHIVTMNITSCSNFSNNHSWIQMHLKFIDKSMEFEFANILQYTPFKWNNSHIS